MILLIVSTAVLLYLTITKKQQRHLRIIAALLLGLGLFQLFFATIIFPVLASVVLLSLAMMLLPLFLSSEVNGCCDDTSDGGRIYPLYPSHLSFYRWCFVCNELKDKEWLNARVSYPGTLAYAAEWYYRLPC